MSVLLIIQYGQYNDTSRVPTLCLKCRPRSCKTDYSITIYSNRALDKMFMLYIMHSFIKMCRVTAPFTYSTPLYLLKFLVKVTACRFVLSAILCFYRILHANYNHCICNYKCQQTIKYFCSLFPSEHCLYHYYHYDFIFIHVCHKTPNP